MDESTRRNKATASSHGQVLVFEFNCRWETAKERVIKMFVAPFLPNNLASLARASYSTRMSEQWCLLHRQTI